MIKSGLHVTQVLKVITFNEESGKILSFTIEGEVVPENNYINFVVSWLILKGILYTLKVLEGNKKSPTLFRCNEKWRNERNLKHFKTSILC